MLKLNNPTLLCNQAFIDGAWQDSQSLETFAVFNPATGDEITQVAKCGAADTKAAITAANAALIKWRDVTSKERSALLMAWHDEIIANIDDLALILTAEMGKPLAESRGEIAYGANYVRWFAEEAKRIYGLSLIHI